MKTIGIAVMETTHKQPIGKQISYVPYRRIASFNGYFYKEDFLDLLLDLKDLFGYENNCDQRKVKIILYKLREYILRQWEQIQTNRICGEAKTWAFALGLSPTLY